jgi:hypothetical protein
MTVYAFLAATAPPMWACFGDIPANQFGVLERFFCKNQG